MRLKPPETKKKIFNDYEDFKNHILDHTAIGRGKSISVRQFFKEVCDEYGDELGINYFITMWPLEYQHSVKRIFENMNKKD